MQVGVTQESEGNAWDGQENEKPIERLSVWPAFSGFPENVRKRDTWFFFVFFFSFLGLNCKFA